MIESGDSQLYICLDLNCPHYQISLEEQASYISNLRKHLKNGEKSNLLTYHKENPLYRNEFITVVNDMSVTQETLDLSKHFDHCTVSKMVYKYDENSKETNQRGNVFFDGGVSCAINQVQCKNTFGLPAPNERSINSTMADEYRAFCNTSEDLLLKAALKLLPLKCVGKEKLLYMIPPYNKLFSSNSSLHATRYAITNKKMY